VVVFILVGAYRLSEGDGGQLKITDQLEININASTKNNTKPKTSSSTESSVARGSSDRNGAESYDWEVDSYWITDKSEEVFCSTQKNAREAQNSKIVSVLVRTDVKTKEEYIPSRMVYYRYKCYFKDKLIN
jgi:hypothetical protein